MCQRQRLLPRTGDLGKHAFDRSTLEDSARRSSIPHTTMRRRNARPNRRKCQRAWIRKTARRCRRLRTHKGYRWQAHRNHPGPPRCVQSHRIGWSGSPFGSVVEWGFRPRRDEPRTGDPRMFAQHKDHLEAGNGMEACIRWDRHQYHPASGLHQIPMVRNQLHHFRFLPRRYSGRPLQAYPRPCTT